MTPFSGPELTLARKPYENSHENVLENKILEASSAAPNVSLALSYDFFTATSMTT